MAGDVVLGLHAGATAEPGPASAEVVGRILIALRARQRTVVDAIVREMHRQLPALWRMRAPSVDADLRLALQTLLGIFASVVEEQRPISREELAAIRSMARRRSRQGIPAEAMTAAVRIAGEVGWLELVRIAQVLPAPTQSIAALGRLGPLLVSFLDETGRSLRDAYRFDDAATADHPGAALVADILTGPSIGAELETVLVDRGRDAGVDLAAGWSILLVSRARPGDDWTAVREVVATLVRCPGAIAVPVTTASSVHATLLLPRVAGRGRREQLEAARAAVAAHPAVILACPAARGPRRLREEYLRAAQLLSMAPAASLAPRLYETADLRLDSLLVGGSADHDHFLRETLGPILQLPEASRRSLLDTVRALAVAPVSGGNRALASATGIHEKTVRRRLDRVRELTGLDADDPCHRAQLLLGHRLLVLAGMEAPPVARGAVAEVELRGEQARPAAALAAY
jgi:PucR C-terminal helix-turn-helix domain